MSLTKHDLVLSLLLPSPLCSFSLRHGQALPNSPLRSLHLQHVAGLQYVGGDSQLNWEMSSAETLNDLLPGIPQSPALKVFLGEVSGLSWTHRRVHARGLGECWCFLSTYTAGRTIMCFIYWATSNGYFLIYRNTD